MIKSMRKTGKTAEMRDKCEVKVAVDLRAAREKSYQPHRGMT